MQTYNYPYASTDISRSARRGSSSGEIGNFIENMPFSLAEPMYDANSDIWTGDGKFFACAFCVVPDMYTKVKSLRLLLENNYNHAALGTIIAQVDETYSALPSYSGTNLGEFSVVNDGSFGLHEIALDYTIPAHTIYLFVELESYSQTIFGRQTSYGTKTTVLPAGLGHKQRGVSFGAGLSPDMAYSSPMYRVIPWLGLEVT